MSITAESAAAHKNDPAVVCCRTEAGTVLGPENFEDPGIFPDLVDSGLLKLDENVLTLGQALGATLTKTIDSLTPVTADIAENINNGEEAAAEEEAAAPVEVQAGSVSSVSATVSGGVFKLHIGEGKDIDLEIPLGGYGM